MLIVLVVLNRFSAGGVRQTSAGVVYMHSDRLVHVELVCVVRFEIAQPGVWFVLFASPELVRTGTVGRMIGRRRDHINESRTRQFRQELLTSSLHVALSVALDLRVLSGRI